MGPGGLRSEVAGRACGSWWLAETAMASASPHLRTSAYQYRYM